jgi:hypothetical protein
MTIIRALAFLVAPFLLLACSSTRTVKVPVPPRVDLRAYPVVGLVGFESNADSELERLTTQKFLQEIQAAQPGSRVVELGPEAEVLSSTGRRSWDAAALRSVGEQHNVNAVLVGRLDLEKVKPELQLSTVWKKISAKSDVNVVLSARLIETGTSATMWTNSAQLTTNVAHASFNQRGQGSFGARDPEAVYGNMVQELAYAITDDFREHYVLRKVRKSDLQTASARD